MPFSSRVWFFHLIPWLYLGSSCSFSRYCSSSDELGTTFCAGEVSLSSDDSICCRLRPLPSFPHQQAENRKFHARKRIPAVEKYVFGQGVCLMGICSRKEGEGVEGLGSATEHDSGQWGPGSRQA
jgi:hypothetical protein